MALAHTCTLSIASYRFIYHRCVLFVLQHELDRGNTFFTIHAHPQTVDLALDLPLSMHNWHLHIPFYTLQNLFPILPLVYNLCTPTILSNVQKKMWKDIDYSKQRKQQADEYPSQSSIVDQKCQVQSTYFLTQDALGHWLNVHKTVCITYWLHLGCCHSPDSLPKILVSKYHVC